MKHMTLIEFVENVAGKPLTEMQKLILEEYARRHEQRAELEKQYKKRFDPASSTREKIEASMLINGRYGKLAPTIMIIDDPFLPEHFGDAEAFAAMYQQRPAPQPELGCMTSAPPRPHANAR